ncbi:hypothetical protein [uncultured Corynebacterium sp.]|uniref:hypothetical protein n=1 Tax=uncultured Corynebacterium sp. TaxID=159447 RepID=UPI00263114B7|nr:hypothetical protein [uncultured Corynebacterium sp.]
MTDTHTQHRKSIGNLTRRTLLRNLPPRYRLRWTHSIAYHPPMMLNLDEHTISPRTLRDIMHTIMKPTSHVLKASTGRWPALHLVGQRLRPVPQTQLRRVLHIQQVHR